MTEENIIDHYLETYYFYESMVLEKTLKEITRSDQKMLERVKKRLFREELIEKHSETEQGTIVSVSMHAKNLVNAGGYLYFYSDSPPKKPPAEPYFLKEYNVSSLQYFLFWPALGIAFLEAVFILWKLF